MFKRLVSNQIYQESLVVLRDAIDKKKVRFPKKFSTMVFLCGANKDSNNVSARREALQTFAKRNLPNTRFFLAESLLNNDLIKSDKSKNLLDLEESLSQFADCIVVILESPSAFAELGAFCHETLRKKLIVINDIKYKNSESYINLGPIKAIKSSSASGNDCVISYRMNDDGVHHTDSIGDVFDPLSKLLHKFSIAKHRVTLELCDPGNNVNKVSVMMMHDLIYMCGPILHKELVPILKTIFGTKDFKINHHTAILEALALVSRKEDELYRSCSDDLLFNYRIDTDKIVSVFRNYIQQHCPSRIYGH